jgi:hypothetical protein
MVVVGVNDCCRVVAVVVVVVAEEWKKRRKDDRSRGGEVLYLRSGDLPATSYSIETPIKEPEEW